MLEANANPFYSFLYSPIFLSTFFSWFIAQIMKSIIEVLKKRPHPAKLILKTIFWTTGGMPSSHSSVVTALATSVGFEEGIDSALFIVLLFYGLLTIRDALGVRRAAGSQAKLINQMGKELSNRFGITVKSVKEIHGHTTSEVSVGILIGFFISVAFCNL